MHLNPQPTPPSPQPRARSKTPEVLHREHLQEQVAPVKEEHKMETTSPQPGSRPHVKQRTLPQLPPSTDETVPSKQPDEGEATVSPPDSPVLRRSSRTVSRASRGTYLSSKRRNRQTDTSPTETADRSAPDSQVPTDSHSTQEEEQPVTKERHSLPATQEPPTDRSVIDSVSEVQTALMTLGDEDESDSQLDTTKQAAVTDTQKLLRTEDASIEDYSLPVSQAEREVRRNSPLPDLEEGIDISSFNLSTPPSEPPPELSDTVSSSKLEGEEQQYRSTATHSHDEEKVQEDEAQIRQGSQVLSMSAKPQMLSSKRRQPEEKREDEEAPKAFEKFRAEEGIPRSSRVLSTKEGRPKLRISRKSERPAVTKQTDEAESDRQDAQVEPQLSHVVTEAETGQEMKDSNNEKTAAEIEHKKEQLSTVQEPVIESGEKSMRRSSEVIHRKKPPQVSRLSERKLKRTAITEEVNETQNNEGDGEEKEEESDPRFRKVRVQVGEMQTCTQVFSLTQRPS